MILDRSKHIIKRNSLYQKMFNIPEEVLREDIYSKNIEWVKHVMCDPDKFVQSSLELPIDGKKVVVNASSMYKLATSFAARQRK